MHLKGGEEEQIGMYRLEMEAEMDVDGDLLRDNVSMLSRDGAVLTELDDEVVVVSKIEESKPRWSTGYEEKKAEAMPGPELGRCCEGSPGGRAIVQVESRKERVGKKRLRVRDRAGESTCLYMPRCWWCPIHLSSSGAAEIREWRLGRREWSV